MIELFQADIQRLKAKQMYRERWLCSKNLLNFSSNDYLSLSNNESIRQAFKQGFQDYPSGSGGSMLVSGYHQMHQQLEQAFASALAVDDALLFSSGYSANLAITQLLAHYKVQVLIDKEVHASIYDGIHLNQLPYKRYSYKNLAKLSDYTKSNPKNTVLISDSVFSMTGNQVDLRNLMQYTYPCNIPCIIDEAHTFGLKGAHGMGAVEEAQLTMAEIPLRVIPFGKALGCQGAVVAGQKDWIAALLQQARSYVYSTAISPAIAFGLIHSLETIKKAHDLRKHLARLIDYFKQSIIQDVHQWSPSNNAIQLLILGDAHKALAYSRLLHEQGIFCRAIRPPSVTKKNTGLRVSLNANHSVQDIDYLLLQLRYCYDRLH